MFKSGLVSVSFREMTVAEVAKAAKENGLMNIEWGSDVHAPIRDEDRLNEILSLQKEYGLNCCSYGTYFWLGITPLDDLPAYIHTAKRLGTNILRIWAGQKSPDKLDAGEKAVFFAQCRMAAKIAEEAEVTLCLECHNNTYTETVEGAVELLNEVNSPCFKMYWQPSSSRSIEENLAYLRAVKEHIVHIHVFHWIGHQPVPLIQGESDWSAYMKEFDDLRYFLLEFMPDEAPNRLTTEAQTLNDWIEKYNNIYK